MYFEFNLNLMYFISYYYLWFIHLVNLLNYQYFI